MSEEEVYMKTVRSEWEARSLSEIVEPPLNGWRVNIRTGERRRIRFRRPSEPKKQAVPAPDVCSKRRKRMKKERKREEASSLPSGGDRRKKLSADDVRYIRSSGKRVSDLAVELGVSRPTIYHVLNRRIYRNI